MPVYNAAKYLSDAIDSILAQTLSDFEVIAVNDGSSDGSAGILDAYSKRDSRIRVLDQPSNRGISAARNIGLMAARGRYIAVMDSDDVAFPRRLEKQVEFLKANPEIGVCGTRCTFFGDMGSYVGTMPSLNPDETKCRLVFLPTLSNTSVMLRRELVSERNVRYDDSLIAAEDYDLYIQALRWSGVTSIPDILMKIRTHSTSTTRQIMRQGDSTLTPVHDRVLRLLGIRASKEELSLHMAISNCAFGECGDFRSQVEGWLCKLDKANQKSRFCHPRLFSQILFERWCLACGLGYGSLTDKWHVLRHSPLYLGDDALVRYALSIGPKRAMRKLMKGRR